MCASRWIAVAELSMQTAYYAAGHQRERERERARGYLVDHATIVWAGRQQGRCLAGQQWIGADQLRLPSISVERLHRCAGKSGVFALREPIQLKLLSRQLSHALAFAEPLAVCAQPVVSTHTHRLGYLTADGSLAHDAHSIANREASIAHV